MKGIFLSKVLKIARHCGNAQSSDDYGEPME